MSVLVQSNFVDGAVSFESARPIPSQSPALDMCIVGESMNPLGLEPSRFLVVVDSKGACVGFGQLEVKDGGCQELRSMVVDKSLR